MSDGPSTIPLAYLLTWTTYGTWLRGDPRGSVVDDNRFGAPYAEPDPDQVRADSRRMDGVAFRLTREHREIVEGALREVCKHRDWAPHALTVRSNHVHAVVSASCPPERAIADLKAWATRRLRERDPELFAGRVWTSHGSTRYMFDHTSIHAAIDYVVRHQDGLNKGREPGA